MSRGGRGQRGNAPRPDGSRTGATPPVATREPPNVASDHPSQVSTQDSPSISSKIPSPVPSPLPAPAPPPEPVPVAADVPPAVVPHVSPRPQILRTILEVTTLVSGTRPAAVRVAPDAPAALEAPTRRGGVEELAAAIAEPSPMAGATKSGRAPRSNMRRVELAAHSQPREPLSTRRAARIANASGFLGDRETAFAEILGDGDVDFITGDYLAEVTMLILGRQRLKDPTAGFAKAFLRHLTPVLPNLLSRGIKVVVNAGGLNPEGLAAAVRALGDKLGVAPKVAVVLGDDLRPLLDDLFIAGHPLANLENGKLLADNPGHIYTANAYLGAWGIVEALRAGADIVICPRVTDASLVVGPAAYWHNWKRDDWNALAGAVVAGHVIECGAQATGGNYSSFREIPEILHPGFPIAEVAADGSCVFTKHEGTSGAVTVGTVTAQLVYEIGGPKYLNPDVTTSLDTVTLEQVGADRVRATGARGAPPPPATKVAITTSGGFANEMTFVFTGLEVDAKMKLFEAGARAELAGIKARVDFQRIGGVVADSPDENQASALLRVLATSREEEAVGREFSTVLTELALASYPGLFAIGPPGPGHAVGRLWPALIPQSVLAHRVVLPDGSTLPILVPPVMAEPHDEPEAKHPEPPRVPSGPKRRVALGELVDARSGDKGSDANVGLWVRTDEAYAWMHATLTVDLLRDLIPEAEALEITRAAFPKIKALNFVIRGLIDGGATATRRFDRQAKALGEFVRSRHVDVPERLLEQREAGRL